MTCSRQTAPYGTWLSPVQPDMLVTGAVRFGHLCTDGPDIYWVEGRPAEQGRCVVVRCSRHGIEDITPERVVVTGETLDYRSTEHVLRRRCAACGAQLLIVSHQKRTMEAADCLYGVSMQPGGSSKVVSEKVNAS